MTPRLVKSSLSTASPNPRRKRLTMRRSARRRLTHMPRAAPRQTMHPLQRSRRKPTRRRQSRNAVGRHRRQQRLPRSRHQLEITPPVDRPQPSRQHRPPPTIARHAKNAPPCCRPHLTTIPSRGRRTSAERPNWTRDGRQGTRRGSPRAASTTIKRTRSARPDGPEGCAMTRSIRRPVIGHAGVMTGVMPNVFPAGATMKTCAIAGCVAPGGCAAAWPGAAATVSSGPAGAGSANVGSFFYLTVLFGPCGPGTSDGTGQWPGARSGALTALPSYEATAPRRIRGLLRLALPSLTVGRRLSSPRRRQRTG